MRLAVVAQVARRPSSLRALLVLASHFEAAAAGGQGQATVREFRLLGAGVCVSWP